MPQARLIALFGPSCTGKTTLARILADRMGLPLRCCGELIKQRAAERGVPIPELSQEDHCEIDEGTREWCQLGEARIVEGRFLDQVLAPIWSPSTSVLFEISASSTVRAHRWTERIRSAQSVSDVETFDADDLAFRVQAYDGVARVQAHWIVDTTDRSVEACLEEIVARLST